jgi:hypothetical protein
MNKSVSLLVAAGLLAAAVPATLVLAQTPPPAKGQKGPERRPMLSPDARARLLEGRLAMAKTALNLTGDQLRLWAPVEDQIRASVAERTKRREDMRAKREAGTPRERLALPERLDRASQRLAERAERMKKFAEVIKPFYASLNEEQKAIAGVVLRQVRGGERPRGGPGWAMRRGPEGGPPPKQ